MLRLTFHLLHHLCCASFELKICPHSLQQQGAWEQAEGLQEQLLKNEDRFLETLASQLATYALGRELGFSDRKMVRDFASHTRQRGYTLEALLEAIVSSSAFTTK